ncbi:hypothetical protein [Candidatus Binatus sp.]|jgi:hypothetical protein|uniref:hypothetical protein n=1 Tax=Candidatus Binatus sp. TaxID=2811406 RepID=UPI003BDF61A8
MVVVGAALQRYRSWKANVRGDLRFCGRSAFGRPMNLHHAAALALVGWYLMARLFS